MLPVIVSALAIFGTIGVEQTDEHLAEPFNETCQAYTQRNDRIGFLDGYSSENRFLVVIDPGHGGDDNGQTAGAERPSEAELSLRLALELQRALAPSAHLDVQTTRDSDVSLELADRARLADSLNADLFLSLHVQEVEHGDRSEVRILQFIHQDTRIHSGEDSSVSRLSRQGAFGPQGNELQEAALAALANSVSANIDDFSCSVRQGSYVITSGHAPGLLIELNVEPSHVEDDAQFGQIVSALAATFSGP